MLYTDLNYTAQEAAMRNVLLAFNGDEAMANEAIAADFFLFDMNGEIIEERDDY